MTPEAGPTLDAATLRRAFDESFARPAALALVPAIELLGVRLGDGYYAIRISHVAGLRSDLRVTPCPTPLPELIGIAGFGGTLTPVYDLAALLGLPQSSGRWTALVEGGTVALAFADFAGHFRVDPTAIAARQGGSASHTHVREFTTHSGRAWSLIDIPSIVSAIREKSPPANRRE